MSYRRERQEGSQWLWEGYEIQERDRKDPNDSGRGYEVQERGTGRIPMALGGGMRYRREGQEGSQWLWEGV